MSWRTAPKKLKPFSRASTATSCCKRSSHSRARKKSCSRPSVLASQPDKLRDGQTSTSERNADWESLEFDLRSQLEEQRAAAVEEREALSLNLVHLTSENSSLRDQLDSSESKLKDFELHIVELEQRLRHLQQDNKEDLLRREIDLLKSEVERLSESQDEIKIESNDKFREILELRVANKDLEVKVQQLGDSALQYEEHNARLLAMMRDVEKDLREAKELSLARDKLLKELEFKLAEEARAKQELASSKDRLAAEHLQNTTKLQEEIQLLHSLLKKHREEAEANRRRGSSGLFGIDGLNLSDFESFISKGLATQPAEEELNKSGVGDQLDSAQQTDVLADLQRTGGDTGPDSRRESLDMRGRRISLSRERGASFRDSIFQQRLAAMNRPVDERLQAETAELKNRLRQTQEDFNRQVGELLVARADQAEIDSKSKEISSLSSKLADSKKAERDEGFKQMQLKHQEESLRTQLLNLQLDLQKSEAEVRLWRDAVESANLKLSTVVSDYEVNQDVLTRKNMALQRRLKLLAAAVEDIAKLASGEGGQTGPIQDAVRALSQQLQGA